MNAHLTSHTSYGELTILLEGREYRYYNVSAYHLQKIRQFIRQRNTKLFEYLKPFSDKEQYESMEKLDR